MLVLDICYPERFYILLGLAVEYIKYETKPKPVCLFYLCLRIYFLQYVVKRNNVTPRTIAIRFIEAKMRVSDALELKGCVLGSYEGHCTRIGGSGQDLSA